jgi:glutamine amidotransferase
MPRIGILDYGAGNLFSLKCGLEKRGAEVELTNYYSDDIGFDGLILPGVGNFGTAVKSIKTFKHNLVKAVNEGLPFLGICLGAQLIFENSEEEEGKGLEFLKGSVLRIPSSVKIPHMGWNNLEIIRRGDFLKGVDNNTWVYFVHSYYPKSDDKAAVAAITDYGIRFPAVIAKDNVFGTQFHPEKSGETGSKILRNFIKICER